MILIRANIERQIPVIRATLVSAPLASASKYVYAQDDLDLKDKVVSIY